MKKKKLDPNIAAFLADVENGRFKKTKPGTWVAYTKGAFAFSCPTLDRIIKKIKNREQSYYINQVNMDIETLDVPKLIGSTKGIV